MADNIPTSGGLPPRGEPSKVQPKKETVRINLPPKPTSAPTIKLPTLAPGAAPPASGSAAPMASVGAAAPPRAAATPAPASSAAPKAGVITSVLGPAPKQAPAPSVAPRPMAAPVAKSVSGLDTGLAIAAAVISLASLGCVVYLVYILQDPNAANAVAGAVLK